MRLWRRISQRQRTLYSALVLGVAITLLTGFVIQGLPFIQQSELTAYDWHFQLRGDRPQPPQIAVVELDQNSIDDLSPIGTVPIPRHYSASLIGFLRKAGARAICLDFFYPGASRYGAKDDAALASALRAARGKVVINSELAVNAASNYVGPSETLELPYDPLNTAAGPSGVGLANVVSDSDGAIRRADLFQMGQSGQRLATFPLECASLALHKSPAAIVAGLGNNEIYINYNGSQNPGAGGEHTFAPYQFESVALGEDPATIFRNKIVVVIQAAISVAGPDLHTTPYGQMYGGYVQANTLNTILRNDPIQPANDGINRLLVLIVGLIATIMAARFGIWHSTLATLALAAAYIVFTFLVFSQFRYWTDLITPITGLLLVYAAIMALRFSTEERLKRHTARQFGQYVKPEIVEMLVNAPDAETALRGARRAITCLFVDIRGFTAMSEHMEPEQVVNALDVYLEELTLSVQRFDGTTDKYVGDELMAIWNAPSYQDDHALLGVRCALDMVAHNDIINQQLTAKGLPRIRYGIGVNSGEAVVGQMGSSLRKQYTVIGDAVNTGARLCSAAGGDEVIIGQQTWEAIGSWLEVEETEPLRLKGKSVPLRTFRVLSVREAPVPMAEIVPAPAGL